MYLKQMLGIFSMNQISLPVSLLLGELCTLSQLFQSPQTDTSRGQPRLGTLVAVVHISVTLVTTICK